MASCPASSPTSRSALASVTALALSLVRTAASLRRWPAWYLTSIVRSPTLALPSPNAYQSEVPERLQVYWAKAPSPVSGSWTTLE